MRKTVTINQLRPDSGHGLSERNIKIKEGEKWAIGTLEEMLLNKEIPTYEFKKSNWVIGDYYDHLWYIWGRTSETSEEIPLKIVRTTKNKYSDDTVGIMAEQTMLKEKEEYRFALYDGEFNISSYRGEYLENIIHSKKREIQLCNGRGSTNWNVYLKKNEKGEVIAFAIIEPDTLD